MFGYLKKNRTSPNGQTRKTPCVEKVKPWNWLAMFTALNRNWMGIISLVLALVATRGAWSLPTERNETTCFRQLVSRVINVEDPQKKVTQIEVPGGQSPVGEVAIQLLRDEGGVVRQVKIRQKATISSNGKAININALLAAVFEHEDRLLPVVVDLTQEFVLDDSVTEASGVFFDGTIVGRYLDATLAIQQNVPLVGKSQTWNSMHFSDNKESVRGYAGISLGGRIGPVEGKYIQQAYDLFTL